MPWLTPCLITSSFSRKVKSVYKGVVSSAFTGDFIDMYTNVRTIVCCGVESMLLTLLVSPLKLTTSSTALCSLKVTWAANLSYVGVDCYYGHNVTVPELPWRDASGSDILAVSCRLGPELWAVSRINQSHFFLSPRTGMDKHMGPEVSSDEQVL